MSNATNERRAEWNKQMDEEDELFREVQEEVAEEQGW